MESYICRTCGERHNDVPTVYGSNAPVLWETIPANEREARSEINDDLCVIDNQYYFVRGRLEIPILDSDEHFCWLVWVSLSEKNFQRTCELWEQAGRESELPYFGWLQSSLSFYPDTLNLKTNVHTRVVGERPFIDLEPTDHPLAIEQREGITWERVQYFAEQLLHGEA
jgi:hypothetical protein